MNVIPTDFELLEFFECEPDKEALFEGVFLYKKIDTQGLVLDFSFHKIQGSVQINLSIGDAVIVSVCQEGAEELKIQRDASGQYILCNFKFDGAKSKVQIFVEPEIKVNWSTLIA
ncbi:hypothetical protein OE749_08340 [Aestuariibacter sp. AA17]|uniref:Uncharacterized protein n=1 Tax=Fluctibacter corallii TaxID=2984329 RepID=A0ABT3A7N5_9ALTE|nr:hypothetical protein [Aestuariibacter sp. AA17]MCV2884703.1 hypothetical protein [Aestuariibacter sp. AA17]